jgi:hypothetical protein
MSLEIGRSIGAIRRIVDKDVSCVGATIYVQGWISEAEEREIRYEVEPQEIEKMPQRSGIRAKTAVYL